MGKIVGLCSQCWETKVVKRVTRTSIYNGPTTSNYWCIDCRNNADREYHRVYMKARYWSNSVEREKQIARVKRRNENVRKVSRPEV